jgi:hypothetical protein
MEEVTHFLAVTSVDYIKEIMLEWLHSSARKMFGMLVRGDL